MSPRELTARWAEGRRHMRERIAHLLPDAVIFYPAEILLTVIAALMGIPVLVGLSTSASLIALVGGFVFYAWAALLSIGAIVAAVGMKRRSFEGLSSGLTLIGGGFLVYSLALFVVAGWGGALAGAAYICLGVMSLLRSLHFRRIVDIQRGANKLPGGGDRQ